MKRDRKPPANAAPAPTPGLTPRLPAAASTIAVLAWVVFVGREFLQKQVRLDASIPGELAATFADLPFPSFAASLAWRATLVLGLWILWIGTGRAILRLVGWKAGNALERGLIAAGLGLEAWSLLLLGLGLTGLWRPALLRGIFFGATAASAVALFWLRGRDVEPAPAGARAPRIGFWELAAISLCACAAATALLASATPAIFYDALVYHLALPKLYLLRHQIAPTPHNVFSGLPFGLQMIYGLALALPGENIPALVHASFGAANALVLWAWARRYATPATGIFAALLFYLCPAVQYAGWGSGVDLGAAFLCSLTFLAVLRSSNIRDDASVPDASGFPRGALIAGILAGAAMSVKFNVLPFGAVLILVHLQLGRSWKNTLVMAGAALLAFSPWLMKNYFFYGNPLYPFLHDRLGRVHPADWGAFIAAAGSRDLIGALTTWAGFKAMLLQPWNSTLGDWPLGDWLGPAFLLLVPWAFILQWRGRAEKALVLAVLGGFAAWSLSSSLVRYFLPFLPLTAAVAALAVEKGFSSRLRGLGWAAALTASAFNFQLAFRQGASMGLWSHLTRSEADSAYLQRQRTTYGQPYYAGVEFINKTLPPGARVLFLGEARGFYCERDFIASSVYDLNPFWSELRRSRTAVELKDRLRALGVTHLFLNVNEMYYNGGSAVVLPRDDVRGTLFGEFWSRYLRPVFDMSPSTENPSWNVVFELLDAPRSGASLNALNPPRQILQTLEAAAAKR